MRDNNKGGIKGFGGTAGFTFVELMVVLVLSVVASTMFYKSYTSISVLSIEQDQALELNQNLRVGMSLLVKAVRGAGYEDKKRPVAGGVGFVSTGVAADDATRITVTMDIGGGDNDGFDNNGNGIIDEPAENPSSNNIDDDGDLLIDEIDETAFSDGFIDDTGENLTFQRTDNGNSNGSWDLTVTDNAGGGGATTLIENVDALNFVYLDRNNNVLALPLASPGDVRSVEISMVVRSTNEDYSFTDTTTYRNRQDTDGDGVNDQILAAPNDNFHRRLLTARVRCRNMGL